MSPADPNPLEKQVWNVLATIDDPEMPISIVDLGIIVDVELGSTSEPACAAQLFLEYDASTLEFQGLDVDPDGDLGWSQVLVQMVDEAAGTIDLAFGLPMGTVCNDTTGTILTMGAA